MPQQYNLDQALSYANNPAALQGLTDVNAVSNIGNMLQTIKQGVQDGKLSLADYQSAAGNLVKQGSLVTGQISSRGSNAANQVNPIWNQIVSNGFASPVNGKWTAPLPFSSQEIAKLPNNVLPTQNDIDKGLFDPSTMPLKRLQTAAPTPGQSTGTQTPSGGTQAPQPGSPSAPQPSFTPTNSVNQAPSTVTAGNNPNTNIAPSTANSQVQGAPVYSASPNNPGPNGGLVTNGSQAAQDAGQIANEAALQQQLSTQSQQGITSQRAKYLQDLTGVLNQNAQNQLNDQAPGIYEDLNSRGLLRSSALGNSMATAAKSLTANTTNQLEQQAIAGETADLGNLTNIQNTYNQGRNSALQRQFSVEDYNNQIQAGKALGDQYANIKPQTPSTKAQGTQTAAAVLPAAATIAAK